MPSILIPPLNLCICTTKQGHIQIQGNRREAKDFEVAFVSVCCPDGDIVAELRACFMTLAAWGSNYDDLRQIRLDGLYLDIQVLWRHHAFLIPRLYATKILFELH